MRYSNDPRWINTKYAGTDRNGLQFARGARVLYYPLTRSILSGEAAEQAMRDFDAAMADEAFYNS